MLKQFRSGLYLGAAQIAYAPEGVETGVASDPTTSLTLDDSDPKPRKAVHTDNQTTKTEPEADGGDAGDDERDDDGGDSDAGDAGDDPDESGDEPLDDLGDYSDERHDEFDARYRTPDGALNESVLTQEFDQNAAAGKTGLNEGTYKYFEALGFSRDFVKSVEAGQVALRQQSQQDLVKIAGSQEALNTAITWGKKTYTPSQKARFNEAMKSKDPEVRAEAVETLVARYERANKTGPLGRRRTTPLASATERKAGTATTTSGGFASRDEWIAARKEAKGDPRKEAKVLTRLRASNRRSWGAE